MSSESELDSSSTEEIWTGVEGCTGELVLEWVLRGGQDTGRDWRPPLGDWYLPLGDPLGLSVRGARHRVEESDGRGTEP